MSYGGEQYRVTFFYKDGQKQSIWVLAHNEKEARYLASQHLEDPNYAYYLIVKQ